QGFDEYRYLEPDFFFGASEPASQLALYSGLRLVRERFLAHSVNVHQYYQPAEVVTAEVRRWLDRGAGEQPFFLFVHYMDPHDPYFAHPFNGEGYARVAQPNPPPALAERLHRLYEGEVAYLDAHLGVLFDDLRRRELYDLPHDPGERQNVVASAPGDAADRMRAALGRSVLEARQHGGASEQAGVDAATRARLKAPGYIQE